MNCNCISTSKRTSKLVKRLRQVFLLIKQSIPLFTSLLCHFGGFLNNSASFFEPIVLSPKLSVLLTSCFWAFFSTFSFRCSLFSFLLYFGNLFVLMFIYYYETVFTDMNKPGSRHRLNIVPDVYLRQISVTNF